MILYFGKSKQTFTCTKSTTDTLEKGKNLTLFWYLYCKLRTGFMPFSSVSITNFERSFQHQLTYIVLLEVLQKYLK